ncbi:hypothetical protein B0H34DRAFT_62885 [Crassisporium funariophilum]|nr:hypothetical protein B0H34DRAFT_62885 [Crassisporium funariophilum]
MLMPRTARDLLLCRLSVSYLLPACEGTTHPTHSRINAWPAMQCKGLSYTRQTSSARLLVFVRIYLHAGRKGGKAQALCVHGHICLADPQIEQLRTYGLGHLISYKLYAWECAPATGEELDLGQRREFVGQSISFPSKVPISHVHSGAHSSPFGGSSNIKATLRERTSAASRPGLSHPSFKSISSLSLLLPGLPIPTSLTSTGHWCAPTTHHHRLEHRDMMHNPQH